MKQLLKNMRGGETEVVDVPCPAVRPGTALVRTAVSLVSAGTERMVVEFAEKNLVNKARSRPDLVRQVVDKARREGVLTAAEAAINRLEQPMALGYSSAGTIVEAGEGLSGFKPGDRVACAGGGYAVHAEYAIVPQNLLTHIPDNVDFESAAFTTLGAIALQGFRLSNAQVGENVAVIGLGLLGLLSVGIARSAGCNIFGVDLNPDRIDLAVSMGAVAVNRAGAEEAGLAFSQGRGFDVVLICADTPGNDPVELAGALARDRGIVVAVGAVGLEVPRKIYYEKELQIMVSRSYGPGRYDPVYEEGGMDYPYGYVRWTEGRNFEAILGLMERGTLEVKPLISHRFSIDEAAQAYDLITGKISEPYLGVLITYPEHKEEQTPGRIDILPKSLTSQPEVRGIGLGVLGSGNYATAVFLPAVKRAGGVDQVGIASATGLSARHAAKRFGFQYASSSEDEILQDQKINLVAILTRHNQHARQIKAAIQNQKHVFCEKPLAILPEELEDLANLLQQPGTPIVSVGFNRRFASFSRRLADFFNHRAEPMAIHYRVNAGYLPLTHWLHDPAIGGGRVVGEGCHFIDYLTFLVGSPPTAVQTVGLPDAGRYREDNVIMSFSFADGSSGVITYLANGDKALAKEHVEVFCGGKAAVLDDFRRLELAHNGKRQVFQSRLRQDKGHQAGWEAFLEAVRSGGKVPIPYDHMIGVSRAAFAAVRSLRSGRQEAI